MPSRMYSTIQLLEIMRRSAFKSPLSYPFLLGYTYFMWCHHVRAIFPSETLQSAGSIYPPRIAP
jgi:hypothetical protein